MPNRTQFVNFVLAIPKDQNPYVIVKDYLVTLIVPSVPKWYPLLLGLNLSLLALAILQSSFILYVLITTRQLTLISATPLGLWKVDTISSTAILSWIYSFLATLETLSEEFSRNGHHALPLGWQHMLSPLKFILIYWISFCYVWATFCHVVMIIAKCCLFSKIGAKLQRQPLRHLKSFWYLNFAFLAPMAIISGSVISGCVPIYKSMVQVEGDYHQLVWKLQEASASFDPKTYTPMSIFQIMLSAHSFSGISSVITKNLNYLNWVFLTGHLSLMLVYMPILLVSLRDLKQKAKVITKNLAISSHLSHDEWDKACLLIKSAKAALTFRSWAIFLEQISWWPSIIWSRVGLRYGEAFVSNPNTFWIAKLVTLTFPVASLNFNLFILAVFTKDNFLNPTSKSDDPF